jgi:hypothetical protein
MHARIEYDDKVIEDDFYYGSISNSTSVGGIFNFNKEDVKLDDGKFEVLLVRNLSNPLESFKLLDKVRKKDYDGDKIIYFKASTVKIRFDKPVAWTLDGEFGGDHDDIYFAVLNRAIDVFSGENQMFLGNKIDIPVFDVSEVNTEEAKKEEPQERFTKFRRRKKAKESAEAQESADAEASEAGGEAPLPEPEVAPEAQKEENE